MDATAGRRPARLSDTFIFLASVVSAAVSAALDILTDLERSVVAVVTGLILVITLTGLCIQYRTTRQGDARSGVDAVANGPAAVVGPARIAPVWLGMAVVFTMLTFAVPLFAPVAFFAGLMAFRRHRVAAGVGLAMATIALAGIALAVVLNTGESDPPQPATPAHERTETEILSHYLVSLGQGCLGGVVDPDVCLALDAGRPDLVLAYYGYPECRRAGGSVTLCASRLPSTGSGQLGDASDVAPVIVG